MLLAGLATTKEEVPLLRKVVRFVKICTLEPAWDIPFFL